MKKQKNEGSVLVLDSVTPRVLVVRNFREQSISAIDSVGFAGTGAQDAGVRNVPGGISSTAPHARSFAAGAAVYSVKFCHDSRFFRYGSRN